MGDNWDDGEDEWDVDDDALDAKLGIKKEDDNAGNWDDEEDLAVKEKEAQEKAKQADLKKKGSALQAKKQAEKDRLEEIEIAKRAMELEAELEAKLSPEERRALERQRIEEADHELTDDLFGAVDKMTVTDTAQSAGDKVVMKDMKDHMKHARKVADCMKVSFDVTKARINSSIKAKVLRIIYPRLFKLNRATERFTWQPFS
jgi:translation initiation factor 3 subunit J